MFQVKDNSDSAGNKSLIKALSILSTFDASTPMQRTSDIALRLNMNISTVSRHLNTLLDWGFLERDDMTGFYSAGYKIIALAGAALQNNDVYRYASVELPKLSMRCNIHSHMGIPRMGCIVHIISNSCEKTSDLLMPMGHCQPMYCSAMGRAILAFLPQNKSSEILKNSNRQKYASETKTELNDLKNELKRAHKDGYAIVINELNDDTASLAAPIFDRNGTPIAAISVSTSARSLSRVERQRELAQEVVHTANKISAKIGYFPK